MRNRDGTSFQMREFVKDHSCMAETGSDIRQASNWIIGQHIKSKCRGMSQTYKPKEIIEEV